MSTYLVTCITAQNLDWVTEYLAKVPEIVHHHGGKYLGVSKGVPNAVELVEGTAPVPQAMAILTFPSTDAIKSFLESPEYAPYKKARHTATESNFFVFETMTVHRSFSGSNGEQTPRDSYFASSLHSVGHPPAG